MNVRKPFLVELTQNLSFHQGDVTVQVDIFPCLNFPQYVNFVILCDCKNKKGEPNWKIGIQYLNEEDEFSVIDLPSPRRIPA